MLLQNSIGATNSGGQSDFVFQQNGVNVVLNPGRTPTHDSGIA